jgi:hypothetical protein
MEAQSSLNSSRNRFNRLGLDQATEAYKGFRRAWQRLDNAILKPAVGRFGPPLLSVNEVLRQLAA